MTTRIETAADAHPGSHHGAIITKTRYVVDSERLVGPERLELVDDAEITVKAWTTEGQAVRIVSDTHVDVRPDLTFIRS